MDLQLDTRNVFPSVLIALVVAAGFLILTPQASAEKSDCPAGKICVWAGPTFGGAAAFFDGSETGCKALSSIDPRSAWNHTGNHTASFPSGTLPLGPGGSFSERLPYTGSMCIS